MAKKIEGKRGKSAVTFPQLPVRHNFHEEHLPCYRHSARDAPSSLTKAVALMVVP